MDNCPLTGKPCPYQKTIHITEIKDYQAVGSMHCCPSCSTELINQSEVTKNEPMQIGPQLIVDVINNLINSTFGAAPKQIVIANSEKIPENSHPPCPSCGASLKDIEVAKRLGCPHCYTHWKHELLPGIVHAHKSCEHVGKSPKVKPCAEESVQTLELKLKQAVEREEYEIAKEIKDKLDKKKAQQ